MADLLDEALKEMATCNQAMTEEIQMIDQIFQHSAAIKETLRAGNPSNATPTTKAVSFACPKQTMIDIAKIVEKFNALVKDDANAASTKLASGVGFEEFLENVGRRTNTLGEAMRSLLSLENNITELTENISPLPDGVDTF